MAQMERDNDNEQGSMPKFTLQIGEGDCLWLHTTRQDHELSINLVKKEAAFEVMAQKMSEEDFGERG